MPERRLLFINKKTAVPSEGDAIFNKRVRHYLGEAGHKVTPIHLNSSGKMVGLMKAVRSGLAPTMARFFTKENQHIVSLAVLDEDYDEIIVSHEALIPLVGNLPFDISKTVILHNYLSQFEDAGHSVYKRLRFLYGRTENFIRAQKNLRLCFLSKRELALANKDRYCGGRPNILLQPGVPPGVSENTPTDVCNDIVVSGSYGWHIKARDLNWFATMVSDISKMPALSGTWYVHSGFKPKVGHLRMRSVRQLRQDQRLRIGIIADRFVCGFKMKSLWYIGNDCLIMSFSDIRCEFAGLPGAEICVNYVRNRKELKNRVEALGELPQNEILKAFAEFKTSCIAYFDWQRQIRSLLAV